jgi:hypothetical protein
VPLSTARHARMDAESGKVGPMAMLAGEEPDPPQEIAAVPTGGNKLEPGSDLAEALADEDGQEAVRVLAQRSLARLPAGLLGMNQAIHARPGPANLTRRQAWRGGACAF